MIVFFPAIMLATGILCSVVGLIRDDLYLKITGQIWILGSMLLPNN
jgi:type IV secretory pathway TrbD component